ncbi:hypothetical protein EOM81_13220 [bacterium]|nr:hypothetical protein [bacterium]
MFKRKHENYKELVMRLAKTDFKLRYHGSTLGYLWAILRPLLMFTVLNFVFSSMFNFRNSGTPNYPLELLTGLLMFQFFSEGTVNGMNALLAKSQLVTKIYVPRWTIILGSSVNALFVYGMNLVVLSVFFIIYGITAIRRFQYFLWRGVACNYKRISDIDEQFIRFPVLPVFVCVPFGILTIRRYIYAAAQPPLAAFAERGDFFVRYSSVVEHNRFAILVNGFACRIGICFPISKPLLKIIA